MKIRVAGKTKPVRDAKRPLILHINPDDVRGGKIKEPGSCAAAVALKRQCKGALSAHVHLSRVYVEYPNHIERYATPPSLRTEIVSFDRGHRFEDGDYKLEVIPASNRLGVRKHGKSGPNQYDAKMDAARKQKAKKNPSQWGWSRAPLHRITGVRSQAPRKAIWNMGEDQ